MGPKRASLPGGCRLGSVLPAQTRSVAPEPFEVVVRALLGAEHMHHDVDVFQEPPPRAGFAFAPDRTDAESVSDLFFVALDHRLYPPLPYATLYHSRPPD